LSDGPETTICRIMKAINPPGKKSATMDNKQKNGSHYLKFFAMIITSMIAMFFLMYTHSYQIIDHFWFSETRLFMTLIMGGAVTGPGFKMYG